VQSFLNHFAIILSSIIPAEIYGIYILHLKETSVVRSNVINSVVETWENS
jgi:hypothetical protein